MTTHVEIEVAGNAFSSFKWEVADGATLLGNAPRKHGLFSGFPSPSWWFRTLRKRFRARDHSRAEYLQHESQNVPLMLL